uniref:HAT C-terminal dimerisation domain-containing protein n=1 Tax=Lactuca sativa TaxID=4236 RepID=A0A9R1XWJ7_LACSA|nr:hypothetical protein LSAT_V11C100020820 [Lactuca sativa]
MDGNSSHASLNPLTTTTPPTNTRSNANTTSINANKDMEWECGVQKDPLINKIFGAPCVTRECVEGSQDTPILRKFAITVLSQTCSASPCERNWSIFDNVSFFYLFLTSIFIIINDISLIGTSNILTKIILILLLQLHSKKRNCLLQQKLNDLVFIQYNTRLQKRFMSLQNKSLDPILLRDVEENDDWTIPTEDELQDFVDGGDNLLWSDVQEAMVANVDTQPNIRSKRERYRDDDDDITDVGNDPDEEVNALDDVNSEAEPMPYD